MSRGTGVPAGRPAPVPAGSYPRRVPFGDLGFAELVVLLVLGLFVFGPERLPGAAATAGRLVRQARQAVEGWSTQLRSEMPEVADLDLDLRSLNPRTLATDALFGDPSPRRAAGAGAAGGAAAAGLGAAVPGGSQGRPLQPWEPAPVDPEAT